AGLVRGFEARADLLQDILYVLDRDDAALGNHFGQRTSRKVLHRQVEQPRTRLTEIVDADHRWRADLARGRRLAAKPRDHRLLVGRYRARDHLERDQLVQHLVVGEIDRTHAAFTEQTLNSIALREHLAGLECRRQRRRFGQLRGRRAIERLVVAAWL